MQGNEMAISTHMLKLCGVCHIKMRLNYFFKLFKTFVQKSH
jgi:hypothetical protein